MDTDTLVREFQRRVAESQLLIAEVREHVATCDQLKSETLIVIKESWQILRRHVLMDG